MLEIKNLVKKYNAIRAVDDVSFKLKKGETTAYLGPNGAGKTTTLKMMACLLEPTQGHIFHNGTDIRKDPIEYKKHIGYIPENSQIYPHLSASEYLTLVGRLRHIPEKELQTKIKEMMRLLDLSVEMDFSISSYSKGMIQKVLIASSLLHDPDILLFDEPLTGLDVTTGQFIKDLLNLLVKEGKTIIYSSHILEVVEKICSRIIIIHEGRIVADDSGDNLRKLMKAPSLESIFGKLTVSEDTQAKAKEMMDIITYKTD
jgi:ABC-2 type transport system ATP-binding protein